MPHEPITYRRSDLYQQVWAELIRTIAKRHGVSDFALAKCADDTRFLFRAEGTVITSY